ncbi:MAG: hypothetical protein ABWY62_01585 [Acidimicrobiia bacterium]
MTGDSGTGRRLIDEVRRLGIETAAEVAHRFSRLVAPLDSGRDSRLDRLAGDVVEATVAMLRVMQDLAELAGGAATGDRAGQRLEVAVPEPGGEGTATLWVHNTTGAPATLTLAASDLVGAMGRIPAVAVTFQPRSLGTVPADTSRSATVLVRTHPGARPGHYHGVVTAVGTPGAVLALRVMVGPDR